MNNTNNYFLPKDALEDICSVAVAKTLLTLGLSSGEINFSQAKRVFGKDFLLLYNTGRVRPVSVGRGKGGTIKFRVEDILAAKQAERGLARMQLGNIKNNKI